MQWQKESNMKYYKVTMEDGMAFTVGATDEDDARCIVNEQHHPGQVLEVEEVDLD